MKILTIFSVVQEQVCILVHEKLKEMNN